MFGMSVPTLKTLFMKEYGVTATELDKGEGVPSCVYMHKSYFRYNGEYLPQDYCKGGKANSIYNRMRGQSQSGADVRLLWTIEVASLYHADILEDKLQLFASNYNVSKNEAFGTELFKLSDEESIALLKRFVDEYNLKDDPTVVRISIYHNDTRTNIFEKLENIYNANILNRDKPKNNFDGIFSFD